MLGTNHPILFFIATDGKELEGFCTCEEVLAAFIPTLGITVYGHDMTVEELVNKAHLAIEDTHEVAEEIRLAKKRGPCVPVDWAALRKEQGYKHHV